MTITNKRERSTVKFSKLPIGATFMFKNCSYVKIRTVFYYEDIERCLVDIDLSCIDDLEEDYCPLNGYCFDTGSLDNFEDFTEVEVVNMELIIT